MYHVSQSFTVLDGYNIYLFSNLIVALVAVQSQFGEELWLYRWMKRNDQCKVDLCRMGVERWNWERNSGKSKRIHRKIRLEGVAGSRA